MSLITHTPTPVQDYLRLLPAALEPSPMAMSAAIALDAVLGKTPASPDTVPFVVDYLGGTLGTTPVLTVALRDFLGDALRGAMLEEAVALRGGADTDAPSRMGLSEEGAVDLVRHARGVLDSRDSVRTLARSVAWAVGYAGLMSEAYAAVSEGGTFAVAASLYASPGRHSSIEVHVVPLPTGAHVAPGGRA